MSVYRSVSKRFPRFPSALCPFHLHALRVRGLRERPAGAWFRTCTSPHGARGPPSRAPSGWCSLSEILLPAKILNFRFRLKRGRRAAVLLPFPPRAQSCCFDATVGLFVPSSAFFLSSRGASMSCKRSWIQGCSLEAAGTNFEHRGNPGFGQSLKLSILPS